MSHQLCGMKQAEILFPHLLNHRQSNGNSPFLGTDQILFECRSNKLKFHYLCFDGKAGHFKFKAF